MAALDTNPAKALVSNPAAVSSFQIWIDQQSEGNVRGYRIRTDQGAEFFVEQTEIVDAMSRLMPVVVWADLKVPDAYGFREFCYNNDVKWYFLKDMSSIETERRARHEPKTDSNDVAIIVSLSEKAEKFQLMSYVEEELRRSLKAVARIYNAKQRLTNAMMSGRYNSSTDSFLADKEDDLLTYIRTSIDEVVPYLVEKYPFLADIKTPIPMHIYMSILAFRMPHHYKSRNQWLRDLGLLEYGAIRQTALGSNNRKGRDRLRKLRKVRAIALAPYMNDSDFRGFGTGGNGLYMAIGVARREWRKFFVEAKKVLAANLS